MATMMTIQEGAAEELRTLAHSLDQTPDAFAQEALAYGIKMIRRYAQLKHTETADAARVMEVPSRVGSRQPAGSRRRIAGKIFVAHHIFGRISVLPQGIG